MRDAGILHDFEEHDSDGYPDYTIWLPGDGSGQLIECKSIRDVDEAYRKGGVDVAYS